MGGIDSAHEAVFDVVKGIVRRGSGLSVECGECWNLPKEGFASPNRGPGRVEENFLS